MKLYNTLSRTVEEFKPSGARRIGVYTCGPTVYDRAHLGNMRTYILSDVLVRSLKLNGYTVTHVMNITDIDDKMIDRAQHEGMALSKLAEKYEGLFLEDMAKLNIETPSVLPRATEHFPEMKQLLNTLVEKGYGYESGGSVYFDISKFPTYGKLSRLDKRQIKPGARVASDEYAKDDVNDFALWKVDPVTTGHRHELTKGAGRPGWHLECSAMSMKYLGATIDIHLGGVDLIFPHHENEIAQSEAATAKPFVRYFVHGEHMLVDGAKMSKSLGNVYGLADIEKKGIDPLAFRYLILSTHYRSKLNFTWDSLQAAARALKRVNELAYRPKDLTDGQKQQYIKAGYEALNNDLDTPRLLAILHEADSYDLWQAFEPVLSLGLDLNIRVSQDVKVEALVEVYKEAKARKDYVKSDRIRHQIKDQGFKVEDTEGEPRVIPIDK